MAKATRKKTEVDNHIPMQDWNAVSVRYVLGIDVALSQLNYMTSWMNDTLNTVDYPDKNMLDHMIKAVSGSSEILANIALIVEHAYDKRTLNDSQVDPRKVRTSNRK